MNEKEQFENWKTKVKKDIEDEQHLCNSLFTVLGKSFSERLLRCANRSYAHLTQLKQMLEDAETLNEIRTSNGNPENK